MAMKGYQSKVFIDGSGVSGVTSFTSPTPEIENIDATHLNSPNNHREYIAGMIDPGQASFDCHYDNTQASWLHGLRGTTSVYKFQYPDDSYFQASGYINSIESSVGGENEIVSQTVSVQLTGALTFNNGGA